MKIKKAWIKLSLIYLLSTGILYGYFHFKKDISIVYKNWDGPSYTLAALSLYKPEVAAQNNYIRSPWITSEKTFLPAHFPLLPLMIRALSGIGHFQAMILLTNLFSLLALIAFYELISELNITKKPFFLTLPMIFLPPRWFIVSHVGSSEPIFIFFLLLFLLFFRRKKHFKGAIFASLAQLTRPQGSLIAVAIALYALIQLIRKKQTFAQLFKKYFPYLLIPATLLAIFSFYKIQTGNFFAFFEAILPFGHSKWPPFSSFVYPSTDGVETFWQEVNAYDFVLYFASVLFLFRKKLNFLGILSLIFYLPLPFIAHSDISRYALPLMPMAFIAFSELIEKKEFTLATLLISPAIYAYAVNFMLHNHAP